MRGTEREVQRVQWLTVNGDFCPMWSQCNCAKETARYKYTGWPGSRTLTQVLQSEKWKVLLSAQVPCSDSVALQWNGMVSCQTGISAQEIWPRYPQCLLQSQWERQPRAGWRWQEGQKRIPVAVLDRHSTQRSVTAWAGAAVLRTGLSVCLSVSSPDGPASPPGHSSTVLLHRAGDTTRENVLDRDKTRKISDQLLP